MERPDAGPWRSDSADAEEPPLGSGIVGGDAASGSAGRDDEEPTERDDEEPTERDPEASTPCDPEASSRPDPAESAWRDRLPSNEVALAIASREHVVVAELPPLYRSIDPDGLDAFLRSAPEASVTFTHHGYEVAVTGRGVVELTPLEEP